MVKAQSTLLLSNLRFPGHCLCYKLDDDDDDDYYCH